MANSFLRYLYAVKTHPRAKLGPKQFTTFEVPAAMVEASTELTPAARALGESVRLPTPCTFAGLSPEDVASIFAAFHRKEVHLAGGRFTRVPTVWNLLPNRRLNPHRRTIYWVWAEFASGGYNFWSVGTSRDGAVKDGNDTIRRQAAQGNPVVALQVWGGTEEEIDQSGDPVAEWSPETGWNKARLR